MHNRIPYLICLHLKLDLQLVMWVISVLLWVRWSAAMCILWVFFRGNCSHVSMVKEEGYGVLRGARA